MKYINEAAVRNMAIEPTAHCTPTASDRIPATKVPKAEIEEAIARRLCTLPRKLGSA
ncbi:MAG: hypothetical protein JW712_04195 [Dehalococcoidales bacterium]|nr:hypothetical protein [Dehalococcoidales bacterium]